MSDSLMWGEIMMQYWRNLCPNG